MVANPDNRQILNQFPKLLNKLYTKSLFQSIALKETDPRHFDTIFYYLSGIPSYRSITIDYLRQASDLEQYVTMDMLVGKVSCLHHLNILFNLCRCAAGIEILTIFIQKVPHIITGLTEQIGKGLITTIGETAITYSYLYLILSHDKEQEFLSKHPFLLKSLTVENLCRKITDQFPSIQPQGESSGLLMLSKQKIGHHLLLKMLQLYPQLFIHFPTEPIFESYHHAEGIISSYSSLISTEIGYDVLQLLAEKNDEIKTRLDSCFMGCKV